MKKKFRVLIPAAGRSSRSGLNYPKTLYRIGGVPILIRLCKIFSEWDKRPLVIINPDHKELFEKTFEEFAVNAELAYQADARGMGDAIVQAEEKLSNDENIILVWSDIPLLSIDTVRHLVNAHVVFENDFSFVTSLCESCYTIVQRESGRLKRVIETRAMNMEPGRDGEREIGLFVFNKLVVLPALKRSFTERTTDDKSEYGFLHIIEKLVENGKRVEGYPVAVDADILSFNTPQDLAEIEKKWETTSINEMGP